MPKVFISYSHDSSDHKDWVYRLACELVDGGVDVKLDQFDAKLGASLMKFMEKGLTEADRVLVVCTDQYNAKAKEGVGGVGYENIILTAALYRAQDSTKFVPCIRGVSTQEKVPPFLDGRKYLDFSDDAVFDEKFRELLADIHGVQLRPKPPLGVNPFASESKKLALSYSPYPSTSFFWYRMGKAFPGVRGLRWFQDPCEAVERLELLFGPDYGGESGAPIWWWRNGELGVDSFSKLSDREVLLGPQEFRIERIAAFSPPTYYHAFVYVEAGAMLPALAGDDDAIPGQLEWSDYAKEEYGLFRGRAVTREEYDDGSAEIDGRVVDMEGEAELRVRYLTKINFVLAAQGAAINNGAFDVARTELLVQMLAGNATIEDLVSSIEALPKRTEGAI